MDDGLIAGFASCVDREMHLFRPGAACAVQGRNRMSVPLRVLLIEDNENDALLLLRELRRGGYDVASRRVESAAGLIAALEGESWDTIISDAVLPGFSGMEALSLVRKHLSDTPFILVSGKIGEETAVAAMKAGANDYLMKDNLARLAPALQREIQEHHIRCAAKAHIQAAQEELEQRVVQRTAALEEANARLTVEIAERQRAEEALKEDGKRLLAVIETQYEIAKATPDPHGIMQLIADRAQQLVKAAGAGVVLIEGEDMILRAATGTAVGCLGLKLSAHSSLTGHCIREGKTLYCEDTESDPRVDLDACRKMGARSMIAVPLRYNQITVGVLTVFNCQPHAFADHDLYALELMAGQLAAAIAHATEFAARQSLLAEQAASLNAICDSEQRLQLALQASRMGTWDWNMESGRIVWDEAMCSIMGVSPKTFGESDGNISQCAHPEDQAALKEVIDRILEKDVSYDHTVRILWPDGTIRYVSWSGRASRNADGKPVRVTGVCVDVTDKQRMLDELAGAKNAAEAANHSKSEFLANMSHEIRTPMAAIIGHADMLLDNALPPDMRTAAIRTIHRQGEHLLSIINDILDLSKIEAGKMEVECLACNPCQIVDDVVSLMRVRAVERGIHLDLQFQGRLPKAIQTDPMRLRQILVNLVGNAIKFTEVGGVQIVVSLVPGEGPQDTALRFEVIDSGVGMSAEQLENLFQPFKQGDSSTTRRFGGSGLGLTIARRMAAMLGGDITARSMSGIGSRFTLTIATGSLEGVLLHDGQEAVCTEPCDTEIQNPAVLRGEVLLAEDGPANQRVITYYLEKAGLSVTTADNGRIACKKVMDAIAAGKPFDVVLMDMQMPELDGYGAAAKLRGQGYKGPIIALTAHAMSHDREKCLRAGCSDYLSKPIEKVALLNAIAAALPKDIANAVAAGTEMPNQQALQSALESNDDIRQFLPMFLAELPGHVEQISLAMAEQDCARLAAVVHRLKGSGGMYGFGELTTYTQRLETLIEQTKSVEAITADLQALVEMIQRIEGYPMGSIPAAGVKT
jgi:PAS domain S-box-containing protein